VVERVRPGARTGGDPVVWRRATGTAYVESPERVVVLDLEHLDRAPYVFEGSAAQVWACVDGDRTESDIVTDLAEAFQIPVDVVTADVRQFVDRLADLGLIVPDARG
jgi:hypothetical protein